MMGRKHYWKLPVVPVTEQTREVDVVVSADIARASDWVDVVRQRYGDLLHAYGEMMKLYKMAQLVGYVNIAPEALTTNLPVEAIPPGLDRDEFVQTFAGMMQNAIDAVPDELSGLMMKNARGGLV
jgi:hypothetical protein